MSASLWLPAARYLWTVYTRTVSAHLLRVRAARGWNESDIVDHLEDVNVSKDDDGTTLTRSTSSDSLLADPCGVVVHASRTSPSHTNLHERRDVREVREVGEVREVREVGEAREAREASETSEASEVDKVVTVLQRWSREVYHTWGMWVYTNGCECAEVMRFLGQSVLNVQTNGSTPMWDP